MKIKYAILILTHFIFLVKSNAQVKETNKANVEYELYLTQISAAEAFLQLNEISTAKEYLKNCDIKYRGKEWDFLNAYLNQNKISITPESAKSFTAIQLSPDGLVLAVGDSDGVITLFSNTNFKIIDKIKAHDDQVTTLDFNSKSNLLVSGARDHKVILWDLKTKKKLFENSTSFSQGIYNVAFNPDDTTIGVVSWERENKIVNGYIKLLRTSTGTEFFKYDMDSHPISGIIFSNDGKNVISCSWGEIVISVKINSKELNWKYDLSNNEEYNNFQKMDMSPDGKTLALVSLDHRVHFLNAETGKLKHHIEPWIGHTKGIRSVKYSPTQKYVATAGDDEFIKIWDAETYQEVNHLIGHEGSVIGLEWSKDENYIYSISKDGTLKSWDLSSPFISHYDVCKDGPWQLPITNDDTLFAAPCSDDNLAIYTVKKGEQVFNVPDKNGLCGDFNDDGSLLVTADFDG
ncbi:MAG: hypothetical protein KDC67_12510, partial [Ignavibacteriae bacterium]|nr:hypothetical protein [Ignavibacteriota bacterium]